ncbi:MAG: hypothetical protein K2Q28_10040 [Hyphomicrobium sp.]|nr:hypothetical protein [Hyphomicrobium sp.]
MKPIINNLLDLNEAFEAVKGQLFGPLDPALVRLKHKEIVQEAKEKREQDVDPRGRLSLMRDDLAERDRKDRDVHARTLTWLLANDRAYRQSHERAVASFTNAGNAIDRAIMAGEKALDKTRQQIDDYLRSTARLSDGRYVMIDQNGIYRDEAGGEISAEDVAEVDGKPIKAFKPYEVLDGRKTVVARDLAELRGWSVEVGDMHNRAADEESPASRQELDDMTERADDLEQSAMEKQQRFEAAPGYGSTQEADIEARGDVDIVSGATMAKPKI